MNDFQFATVPRVICEAGAAQQLADYCKDLGISCPLVVTDPGLIAINLVPPLLDAMTQSGLDYCLFDRVAEDPPEAVVYSAVEAGAQCDGVIGLGGGSSMDVAKVVATLLGGPQRL